MASQASFLSLSTAASSAAALLPLISSSHNSFPQPYWRHRKMASQATSLSLWMATSSAAALLPLISASVEKSKFSSSPMQHLASSSIDNEGNMPKKNGMTRHSLRVMQWRDMAVDEANEQQGVLLEVLELNEMEKKIDAIKERLQAIEDGELSISAYDTAWVAMVNHTNGSDNFPQFPSSIKWILNNQLPDGSWGDRDFFSHFDRLISTLACIVALKTWSLCPEGCEKGLLFIWKNLHKLKDEDPEQMPSGFEVIFPSLIQRAQNLGLEVPKNSLVLQDLYARREQKLKRITMDILHSKPTTLLFSLEGMTGHLDWEKLLKLQHPNGSFLCSTSATAFALMHTKDEKCLKYIKTIVERFNGGVPHSYPNDIFERLWVVDRLDRLGISRYFKSEMKECLNYVHRYWSPKGISWSRDTIELDIDDTSMAFRTLRLHGYEVNADAFENFERGGEFFCFVGQLSQGVTEMLSLYRASQVLFPGERILEEAKKFTYKFLKKKHALGQMADRWIITKDLAVEVQHYLEVPFHASLPRIQTRYYIDQYGGDNEVWIGKVLYRMYNVSNNLYLELAKLDYNHCQKLHQLEWIDIQRWYEDYNLREFGLSEDGLLQAYFVAMSSIFEPEKAIHRFAWARTIALMEAVTYHFYNEANTLEHRSIFLQAFRTSKAYNVNGDRLVKAILKTLSIISLEVQRLHGMEVHQSLKNAWGSWLLKWQNQEDNQSLPKDEAELQVCTINLCSCAFYSEDDLKFHPARVQLTNLTNKICYNLRYLQKLKTGRKEDFNGEMRGNLIETIEVEMQELLQHVVGSNKKDALGSEVKQAFMVVAKSFYYTTFIERKTIESHIDRVLFHRVL